MFVIAIGFGFVGLRIGGIEASHAAFFSIIPVVPAVLAFGVIGADYGHSFGLLSGSIIHKGVNPIEIVDVIFGFKELIVGYVAYLAAEHGVRPSVEVQFFVCGV